MTSKTELIYALRKKIERKYADSAELFPDLTTIKRIPVIRSPSAIVNAVTGVGGLPRGRMTELSGSFSSGKTTLATEIAATLQAEDPESCILYLDFEHAWDASYARKLGLNISKERFIFAQPTFFEQGADIALACVRENLVDLIIADSAAAMTPKSELEGEMDTDKGQQKGTQSALMAQFLSRITKILNTGRKPALLILNQTRANIQIGGRPQRNAPKEIPAGGNALKFYSTIRLGLEIALNEGDELRGTKGTDQIYTQNRVRIIATKNKVAPPYMRGQFIIEYGKGIDNIASVGELAEAKLGILAGSSYNYKGKTDETSFSFRGRETFHEYLKTHPETLKELEEAVLTSIRAEHAKELGLDEIKVQGNAKEIEETMILEDKEVEIVDRGNVTIPIEEDI